MNNGGKRARHSLDQWDRQSEYMSTLCFGPGGGNKEVGYKGRRMKGFTNVKGGYSDGQRQAVDGLAEGANG